MTGSLFLVLRIALAIALYMFLGWALMTLWRDLRRQSELFTVQPFPTVILDSLDGIQNYSFTRAEITVGRDPLCDCHLDDKTVSLRHARLSFHHKQWWVEDLGSTNGTFLNQETVSTPMVITQGDQLRFGQVGMVVSIENSYGKG